MSKKKTTKKSAKKKTTKKRVRKRPKQAKRKNANRSTRVAPTAEPKYITAPHTATTGRRATLTDQITQELVAIIEAGNYFVTACRSVGLPEATFYCWLERGEKELMRIMDLEKETGEQVEPEASELPYIQFLDAIKKAEGAAETVAIKAVKAQFGTHWQAAMTFLERRYPDRWKKRDRLEHTGDGGGPIGLNVRVYIPDNGRGDLSRPDDPDGEDQT